MTEKPNRAQTSFNAFACLIGALCLSANAPAEDAGSSYEKTFTKQCPKLYAIADDFAHECLQKAHSFSRNFYPGGVTTETPETEKHAAYFRAVDTGSHFGLGCTLNEDNKIEFLGIYYSTKSSNYTLANTSPIAYVDFQGNVGIKVDGKIVNFVAVRQFGTDFIPLRYTMLGANDPKAVVDPYMLPPVKNCEAASLPDGRTLGPVGGWYYFSEKQDHSNPVITRCSDIRKKNDQGCRSADYMEFFSSKDRQIVYYEELVDAWLLRDGGDLVVSKKEYELACHAPHYVGVVKEMCTQPK